MAKEFKINSSEEAYEVEKALDLYKSRLDLLNRIDEAKSQIANLQQQLADFDKTNAKKPGPE